MEPREFLISTDFNDQLEFEAYVITCMFEGAFPMLDSGAAYEYIYEIIQAEGGFDGEMAYGLGRAIYDKSYKKSGRTIQ